MQCHTKLKHHWTIMKLIILDNVQLHKLFDDRKLLHRGVITRNMRKNRPLNSVQYQLARVIQNRIGIKDNPGSSLSESATVLLYSWQHSPRQSYCTYLWSDSWVQMNPSNDNWIHMYKGQNSFGRLSTVNEKKETCFMNLIISKRVHVGLLLKFQVVGYM